jgi:hypothetical protein
MQATTILRKPGTSLKTVAMVLAILAAFALVAAGGYIARSTSGGALHSPAVLLNIGAADPGSAWDYRTRHAGTQTVEGPAPQPSPMFHEPGSRRGGSRL